MPELTATEARTRLPAVLDWVADGLEVTITRHGRPVAVVLSPDALRVRRVTPAVMRAGEVSQLLDDARRQPEPPPSGLTAEQADSRVAEVRADRSSR